MIKMQTFDHKGNILPNYNDAEKRQNLMKLARYLYKLSLENPETPFHMGHFSNILSTPEENQETCGTVGCAAGNGPYAGIPKGKETWSHYINRVFLPIGNMPHYLWDFLFGAIWTFVDDGAIGASLRIAYYIECGVPQEFIDLMQEHEGDSTIKSPLISFSTRTYSYWEIPLWLNE